MLFDTKGHCFERDVIMLNVRWYLSYKLSYRDLEEIYLLTAKRDRKAAKRFICKVVKLNRFPLKINIDKSGANTAGINQYSAEEGSNIEIRQCKYLNNIIEQDHRPIKQLYRATLSFKNFRSAMITICGFESMRMIRKRQINAEGCTSAEIFYNIAS